MADKQRRFWQIHLSTAVLLMLSLSGILWLAMKLYSYLSVNLDLDQVVLMVILFFPVTLPAWIMVLVFLFLKRREARQAVTRDLSKLDGADTKP